VFALATPKRPVDRGQDSVALPNTALRRDSELVAAPFAREMDVNDWFIVLQAQVTQRLSPRSYKLRSPLFNNPLRQATRNHP
jgi:hypothetical protein